MARAQTKTNLPVVGFLFPPAKEDTEFTKERVAALLKGLQEEGFVEGTNFSMVMRFAEGDFDRVPALPSLSATQITVHRRAGAGLRVVRAVIAVLTLVLIAFAEDPVALGFDQ